MMDELRSWLVSEMHYPGPLPTNQQVKKPPILSINNSHTMQNVNEKQNRNISAFIFNAT